MVCFHILPNDDICFDTKYKPLFFMESFKIPHSLNLLSLTPYNLFKVMKKFCPEEIRIK